MSVVHILAGSAPFASTDRAVRLSAASLSSCWSTAQCIYRKDVQGKLPFLSDARKFAADALRDLMAGLDSKLAPIIKDPAGALCSTGF